ncbi:MAG TPA: hypothetical protein VF832_19615 [Longimicrobiales bacterium]
MTSRFPLIIALAALAPLLAIRPAAAQKGAGSAGATVLQLIPGSRAAGFSGGYSAMTGDADVLFYNPAGISSLQAGAALSYQPLVEGMGFGSVAASFHLGRLALGAGVSYLNGGTVDEITPDPLYGDQRGKATGATASANESAARIAAALPLANGRFRLGAAAGFISSDIAGSSAGTPLFDVGLQAGLIPSLSAGVALRNLGGSLGKDTVSAPLPSEARVGLSFARATSSGLGLALSADFVAGLQDGTSGVAGGVEVGLLRASSHGFGAVARVGYDQAQGSGGLAPLQLGGGLSLGNIALDYTFEDMNNFGAVHRFGVRWTSPLK